MMQVGLPAGHAPGGVAGPNKEPSPQPAASASPLPNTPALIAARQALANANSEVETDKRNHSPACAAVDQKHVDEAKAALAQAKTAAAASLDLTV